MKKNLFQAVKTYINGVGVGETFTTKHLIDIVGDHEVSTWWKSVNNNPYYRTHTYKSYLKRTRFLSNPKRGVWKVEKHIPEFVTLGTIEFLIGYKKIYNGLTRLETEDKINNTQVERKCEKIIDGETTQQFLASIGMEGQMLRQLIMSQPIDEIKYLIEEREDLENESKDMFTLEDMENAYNHAMLAMADTGHGEDFEEYMKKKFNITL